jgi:hypothetical protein
VASFREPDGWLVGGPRQWSWVLAGSSGVAGPMVVHEFDWIQLSGWEWTKKNQRIR